MAIASSTPFAARIERDVVRAYGADTATFLQGQLSQDVATMVDGESRWSLLLAPTGKVDAWLRATRLGDEEFILDTDAGWGDAVVARLLRFKIRTNFFVDLHRGVIQTDLMLLFELAERDRTRTDRTPP